MVHKTAVERERNGAVHCLYCRAEAYRVSFEWYCSCRIKEESFMTFEEWLQYGIDNKYCSDQFCSTHDIAPMHNTEEIEWEDGGDPCMHVVRLGCVDDWQC
jgi:hypothetical protein